MLLVAWRFDNPISNNMIFCGANLHYNAVIFDFVFTIRSTNTKAIHFSLNKLAVFVKMAKKLSYVSRSISMTGKIEVFDSDVVNGEVGENGAAIEGKIKGLSFKQDKNCSFLV